MAAFFLGILTKRNALVTRLGEIAFKSRRRKAFLMSNTPHELAAEFPDDHALLHELKLTDRHFVTLAERYHEVNGELHRIEAQIETPSDEYTETLKKKRLALIDEIAGILAKAKAAA